MISARGMEQPPAVAAVVAAALAAEAAAAATAATAAAAAAAAAVAAAAAAASGAGAGGEGRTAAAVVSTTAAMLAVDTPGPSAVAEPPSYHTGEVSRPTTASLRGVDVGADSHLEVLQCVRIPARRC